MLRLPAVLARVDALLDDPVFSPCSCRSSTHGSGAVDSDGETYLRMMCLKFRFWLG